MIDVAREHGVDDFQPAYLKLSHAGDAHAVVEITGNTSRALGAGSVAINAATGAVLATQLPGHRDANHATLAALYALHFADYGGALVRWLYFLLGLGGAFLFYSGNLLWIESRRKRRQQQQTSAAHGDGQGDCRRLHRCLRGDLGDVCRVSVAAVAGCRGQGRQHGTLDLPAELDHMRGVGMPAPADSCRAGSVVTRRGGDGPRTDRPRTGDGPVVVAEPGVGPDSHRPGWTSAPWPWPWRSRGWPG